LLGRYVCMRGLFGASFWLDSAPLAASAQTPNSRDPAIAVADPGLPECVRARGLMQLVCEHEKQQQEEGGVLGCVLGNARGERTRGETASSTSRETPDTHCAVVLLRCIDRFDDD
jgi:hypothetical protein